MDLKHKLYDYINEFGWTEESKEQLVHYLLHIVTLK